MNLRMVTVLFVMAVLVGCNAQERRAESIRYLEDRGFQLDKEDGKVYIANAKNLDIRRMDLEKICESGPVKMLFFRHSHLEKDAIRGLEKCEHLDSIVYEETSFASLPDVVYHDDIKKPPSLDFFGTIYGDELMALLGKLKKNYVLRIAGNWGIRVKKSNGSVTNDGIRQFAEARKSGEPIALSLNQKNVNEQALQYLLQVKGVWALELGDATSISYSQAKQFQKEYEAKYGEELKLIGPLGWSDE